MILLRHERAINIRTFCGLNTRLEGGGNSRGLREGSVAVAFVFLATCFVIRLSLSRLADFVRGIVEVEIWFGIRWCWIPLSRRISSERGSE